MHNCLKLDFMVTFDLFMLWIEIMLFLQQHRFIIPDILQQIKTYLLIADYCMNGLPMFEKY